MSAYVERGYVALGYMEGQYPFDIGDSVVIENFVAKSNMTIEQRVQDITTQLTELTNADGYDRLGVLYDPLAKRTMMIKGGVYQDVGGYIDPAIIEQMTTEAAQTATTEIAEQVATQKAQEVAQAALENMQLTMSAVLPDGTVAESFTVNKTGPSSFEVVVPPTLQEQDYSIQVDVATAENNSEV